MDYRLSQVFSHIFLFTDTNEVMLVVNTVQIRMKLAKVIHWGFWVKERQMAKRGTTKLRLSPVGLQE